MVILLLILALCQTPSAAGGNGNAPSDANNANLKDTLAWLKREITTRAAEERSFQGDRLFFEFTRAGSCNVEWRLRPKIEPDLPGLKRKLPPDTAYYSLNFKDLDPLSVKITPAGTLRFSTLNGAHQIKSMYRDDGTGQIMSTKALDSASISLKLKEATAEVKDAFRHAIKLCQ